MDYRLLLFENDKYAERLVHGGEELKDPVLFSLERNKQGHVFLLLPTEYDAFSTRGETSIVIGNEESCTVRLTAEVPRVAIMGNALEADNEIFVNGRKMQSADLIPGDKLLIGNTEIIYHSDWIDICGEHGETYETELFTYINRPVRFEEYPVYKRSPRIIKTEPYVKVQIKAPEKKEKEKKGELVKRILPSCVMIIATVLMSIFMNRGMFMLVMVAATGATMIITAVTYFDDKKNRKAEIKEKTAAYREYLLNKRKELYTRTEEFKEAKKYQNLSIECIEDEVRHYSNRIYERNLNDDDFLTAVLGTASGEPSFKIECDVDDYGRTGDRQYKEMIEVYENFRNVERIPYVIDLKKAHLGIVGRPEYCRRQLRNITTQLAFFHSYHDLCITAVIGEENRAEYEWMRWLPHTNIRSINVSGVIAGENQRDQVLGHIAGELKARSMMREDARKETRFSPHYVFLIDEPRLIINHSIMEHLKETDSELGFSLIYITQTENNLPENIKTILEIDAGSEGTVLMNEGSLIKRKIAFDTGQIDYETFARRLRPLIHNKGVTTQIPENISFLELYGVNKPEEIDLKAMWSRNAAHRSLSVPIGVRGKGDIVRLDLHEKAHGPHGLVAGTTGSGKSEILQSYILSLACNFHPYDVGFLLIDYKGGGMANLFRNLPHLLGTITNLDGAESMRALASIKSELRRRQDIFNKNGVNNINKYSEKYWAGKATDPLPHLFIISDEFAELKKEQPEFMAELVSTARVGRSLGVHLILATQKPSGIVDDQIWSNSRFRLCLKVQNEADSREILHSGDAANITHPGRAYLQVGNNEIYELFQSAYSGGAYSNESESSEVDDRIYVVNELGQGMLINEDLGSGDMGEINRITELEAIVNQIKRVYEEVPCESVARPWLPPLPEQIVNTGLRNISSGRLPDVSFDVGVIDMPDMQAQEVYSHDFAKDGNMVVFGTSRVGKSTAAANAVISLAAKNSPETLNIYIIDLGNSALFGLKNLPQVADYIAFDDAEKFRKLRNILSEEIADRKRRFARANAATFDMYNEASDEVMPAILVVIDNYDVIKEIDFELENYFTRLTRDGQGVGIYTFAAATRANAMKYAVLNNFTARVCNFLADSGEVTSLIGRSEYKLSDIKGRALVSRDKVYIMQEFLPAPYKDAISYRNSINEIIERISDRGYIKAKGIPMLPDKLEMHDLSERKSGSRRLALGLDCEKVEVKEINNANLQLIVGPAGSGKTNVLKVLLNQIEDAAVFIVDSERQDFFTYQNRSSIRYVSGEADIEPFCTMFEELILEREMEYMNSGRLKKPKAFYSGLGAVYLLIDDAAYFARILSARANAVNLLEKAVNVEIKIYAAVNAKQFFGIDPITKFFKNAQNGIILGKPAEQQLLPTGLYRGNPAEDECIVFENGSLTKTKVPYIDE